jgi:hypothetical protein
LKGFGGSLGSESTEENRESAITSNQAIVVGVGADPIPNDRRALKHTQSTVPEPDANGINILHLFHPFESKAGVRWIGPKEPVGATRLLLYLLG